MRYDQRPRKAALTADDANRVRGIGVVIPPRPKRNLRDVRPPRLERADRSVTVTTADGRVRRLNARMGTLKANVVVVKEPPRKTNKRYAGAIYGEGWQTSHAPTVEAKEAREHWFRGVKYDSQEAIEEYIASL